MALTGSKLFHTEFPAWDTNDVASGSSATLFSKHEIDLEGLAAEQLTVGFAGVTVQHSRVPQASNAANSEFVQLTGASAPTDPRMTLKYLQRIDYMQEIVIITEDPITEDDIYNHNWGEVLFWRHAYLGNVATSRSSSITTMAPLGVAEGGSLRPTARDMLYLYRYVQVVAAWDDEADAAFDVASSAWAYPSTHLVIMAEVFEEGSDNAYIHRLAQSYQEG